MYCQVLPSMVCIVCMVRKPGSTVTPVTGFALQPSYSDPYYRSRYYRSYCHKSILLCDDSYCEGSGQLLWYGWVFTAFS